MVLDTVTLKIIYRSAFRPRTPKYPNKKLVDAGGEEDHQHHGQPTKHPTPVPNGEKSAQSDIPAVYIKSRHDDGPTSSKTSCWKDSFTTPGDNGERLRATIQQKSG